MHIVRLLNKILDLVKTDILVELYVNHLLSKSILLFYSIDGWWKIQPKYQYFTKSKIVFGNLIICISF